MSLFFAYHPGRPPTRFKWPGKNASIWLRLWFRIANLIWPWVSRRWYRRYLKSRAWRDTRERILVRDGYRCRSCGTGNYLQVHHLTYERIGYERPNDLLTLCHDCHQRCHGRRF